MSAVVFGTRYCGPVDRVPGRCYVVTRAFHINNLPLVPLGGLLVVEGSETRTAISGITACRGLALPISARSFAWALARCVLFLGGLLSLLGLPVIWLELHGPAAITGPLLGIAMLVTWFLTRRGLAASPARAAELVALLEGGAALPRATLVRRSRS